MIISLYLAAFCAAFCNIWVNNLVRIDGGLLWWVERFYPYPEKFLGKLLRCDVCLSGWSALFASLFCAQWLFVIPTMFLSMSICKIIGK